MRPYLLSLRLSLISSDSTCSYTYNNIVLMFTCSVGLNTVNLKVKVFLIVI